MFREARSGDYSGIGRLYEQLHLNDPPPTDEAGISVFDRILEIPWLHLFVLERDGALVATTYLNIIPNLTHVARPYAIIENVVVSEALRGTGLGKRIIASTLEFAWGAGCYKVSLTTGSRNPDTHAFYRACGFSPETKTAYHVANPAG